MLRSVLQLIKPTQRLGMRILCSHSPIFQVLSISRNFTDTTAEMVEEEIQTSEEAVVQPVAHNKYPHSDAVAFEHTKDNEPVTVGEDDWFAVVQLSGTQYKLGKDDLLFTNKMDYDIGKQIVLNNVLLLGSKHKTIIGHPTISNAKVVCTVEQQVKEKKITVFKFKKRNRYSKKQGYRRQLTALRVDDILF